MGMVKKEIKGLSPVPEVPKKEEHFGVAAVDNVHKAWAQIEKERAGDDKGLVTRTQPIDARSASIERQALIKSVLESPTLAQRVIGLNQADAFKEFEAWFAKAVEVFYSK